MIALGGGAVETEAIVRDLGDRAFHRSRSRSTPTRPGPGRRTRPAARRRRGLLPRALRAPRSALPRGCGRGRPRCRRRRARRRRRRKSARRPRAARELVPGTARSLSSPTRASRASTAPCPACARPAACRGPRAAGRRGGEDARGRRAALARAPAAASGTLVALGGGCDHRRGRVRRRDLPARNPLGRGPDDARRPGRRGDRRQDRDRPPGRQEPRRRLPLARANGHRPGAARDAAGRSARKDWPRS